MAKAGKQESPERPLAPPTDVALVGSGGRARAWLAPLQRAGRLRLVATVARDGEALAGGTPVHATVAEALSAHPDAAFAVALPPRAGLEAALCLAAAGRAAVVEAPLHAALAELEPDAGAELVRVAHGWVTLPALGAVTGLVGRAGEGRVDVEVRGLPEAEQGDEWEVLVHAAALVRALFPAARPRAARRGEGEETSFELSAPGAGGEWRIGLRVRPRGQSVTLRLDGGGASALWSYDGGRESLRVDECMLVAQRTPPSAAVRALAQLLPEAVRGDDLGDAACALRLARRCAELLPAPLPPAARPFRQSAAAGARRPGDLHARLGLRGALPAAAGPRPALLSEAAPPEPFELWAFRAGIKPVVFLTVRPEEVERTAAFFAAAHVESRRRRVLVGAQDCWRDRRDQGEPRVELYIARDATLARRMAALQAEDDPSGALRELGELAGYPPCCVDAFARQDDRANNSRNRYFTWSRTPPGAAPWPWELNNLHRMTVPFFPCSYRCAPALAWARAALAELARAHPRFAADLRAELMRPVLYFDHEHQIAFAGEMRSGAVVYESVAIPRAASRELQILATALGLGDRLTFDDRALSVARGSETIFSLERTDPALGFLAPFA